MLNSASHLCQKLSGRPHVELRVIIPWCGLTLVSHFTGVVPCPRPTTTHRLRQLPSDSHLRVHSLVDSLPCRSNRASCRPPRDNHVPHGNLANCQIQIGLRPVLLAQSELPKI